jgi:hypothetical protein
MKQEYPCIFYRQRGGSPLQVAFVAASAEIDAWAQVPTKRTGNIRNFQRAALKQHIKEVQKFFNDRDRNNASPTAVVIGFDRLRSRGLVELYGADRKLLQQDHVSPGSSMQGFICITWQPPLDTDDDLMVLSKISELQPQVANCIQSELEEVARLSTERFRLLSAEVARRVIEGKTLLDSTLESNQGDEIGDPSEDYEAIDGEDGELDALDDLSPDAKQALGGLSPNERQIVIGRLEFLALSHAEKASQLNSEDRKKVLQALTDELKPAVLIDGQHRVMGTCKLGSIPFLVCALPDATWPELAFQFLVTNRTAKRVQESLLINIVGNSLSKTQRASIEERLRDAGVRVGLIEAVMKAHEDPISPFHRLLAFGIDGESGFLDAAAFRNKVIKLWYERQSHVGVLFDHMSEGKTRRDRIDNWKEQEVWFDLFIAFWSAVRERYAGTTVFSDELTDVSKKTPASKLMTATALKIFQETILEAIAKFLSNKLQLERVPFQVSLPSSAELSELVKRNLEKLTPDFFVGWQISGFDGSKGASDDLAEAIRLVISGERTVAQLKSPKKPNQPHRLFKPA